MVLKQATLPTRRPTPKRIELQRSFTNRCATSLSADQGHHNVVAYTKLPRELFRIASYNTGQVFVAGQTKLAKEKIKRDKDGYVLDAESKRVPVVLQYSSFDFLKDKAKAVVEAHATEAVQRWNV